MLSASAFIFRYDSLGPNICGFSSGVRAEVVGMGIVVGIVLEAFLNPTAEANPTITTSKIINVHNNFLFNTAAPFSGSKADLTLGLKNKYPPIMLLTAKLNMLLVTLPLSTERIDKMIPTNARKTATNLAQFLYLHRPIPTEIPKIPRAIKTILPIAKNLPKNPAPRT